MNNVRAQIAQNVDTLQLDKYEEHSNEEEKDDVESMQEEGQQMYIHHSEPLIGFRSFQATIYRNENAKIDRYTISHHASSHFYRLVNLAQQLMQ